MPSRRSPSFALSKWYLDVVSDDGSVAILYAARLQWGPLRLSYASVLCDTPGGTRREKTTIRGVGWPRRSDGTVSWHNDTLDVRGTWRAVARPFHHTLLRTRAGAIQLACATPLADAEVTLGETLLRGLGYVEHLRMSILPWKLPFRGLHWARHTSRGRSVVSIAWEGRERRHWVWLDGVEQPDAAVTGAGVTGMAGGARLGIEPGRVVRDRGVSDILDRLPALARRITGNLATLREVKRVSRSFLSGADGAADHGWTVHEVVTW